MSDISKNPSPPKIVRTNKQLNKIAGYKSIGKTP
jgi:hypothetical protein